MINKFIQVHNCRPLKSYQCRSMFMTLRSQDNKTFTLLCWMNAKKTTSPFLLLHASKPNNNKKKSGKELTAGLEDSILYAYYLWGASANNLNPQVLGKRLPNHLAPLLNSPLAQYVQHCRNHNMSSGGHCPYCLTEQHKGIRPDLKTSPY